MNRQARKSFTEFTDKERERQRTLRELHWQRPENEGKYGECDDYCRMASELTPFDRSCIQVELDIFDQQTPTDKPKRNKPDLFSSLSLKQDCFLVVLDCFASLKLHKEVYHAVRELARLAYFYDDLYDFNQVSVDYYREEDDGRDLAGYDFAHDDLVKRRSGRSHFLVERALRMRKAAGRFNDDPKRYADQLARDVLRDFERLLPTECAEAVKLLSAVQAKGFRVFVAVNLHISLVLAVFSLLKIRGLSAIALHSLSCGKDIQYIKRKIEENHRLRVTLVPDSVTFFEIKSHVD